MRNRSRIASDGALYGWGEAVRKPDRKEQFYALIKTIITIKGV
jgi:hypothetical protein